MKSNVLVAQSGGPSPVINASLAGILARCRSAGSRMGAVLAPHHGIEGVLKEDLIDLSGQADRELELLKTTPASGFIGTCRYKLTDEQEEDFQRIIDVLIAHEIGYFFYIGGNDSMDTAAKVNDLARQQGLDLVVTGVPKTIDNDVGDPEFQLIDHTPGYGSAARYWANLVSDVNEENRAMSPSECVSVLQAMGRTSGFIPAAARLADPLREMPLQIYMSEGGHTLDSLTEYVSQQLREEGRCIVIVSEGFNAGDLGEAFDGFGHIEYGASRTAVAQVVANHLNSVGLPVRGQATWQVPGVLQRSTSIHMSTVDCDEAYCVGMKAVEIALKEGSGWMATILRAPGDSYKALYDRVPLKSVANSVRHLPAHWLSDNKLDVTDDFVRYARPLIGDDWPAIPLENGIPRFARLEPRGIEKRLPSYLPVRMRQ